MPNQMMPKVNLLKMPDPATQTAKYVNMMNVAKQQEAAERQAALAQQQMKNANADEARKAALHTPALAKAKTDAEVAQLDYVMKFFKATANDLANSTTPEQAVARGERLKQQFPDPALQKRIDETIVDLVSDPSQFEANRKKIITRTLDAKDQFAVTHSDIFDAEGNLYNKETSPTGSFPTRITPGVVTGPADTGAAPAVAPRTPAAPQTPTGAPMRATQGANTTPQDLMQQGMDPRNIPSGMPTVRPASFNQSNTGTPTAGQMSPDMVPAILDSAVQTGVMAQIDLDQMLALAPPQARQGIMDVIRNNNISLQADAPSLATSGMAQQQPMAPNPVQRPQSQFADMRGPAPQASFADLGGQPAMQNTMAQYQVGQQIKGRNQNVSPAPGVYSVPTSDVAAKARAERETPGEVYAKEKARAKAQREAALEAGPKPLTVPQEAKLRDNITKDYKSARSTIDMMLNPVAGVVAAVNNVRKLSPTQKEAITGYSGYLPTIYAGTKSADTAVKNLKGKVTEMGKSVAALTGAIGQMAVQEWRIVSDMIASLDLEGMGAADLDTQLDIIEAQARRAAAVTRDAYENQYVEEFARYPGRFRLPDASAVAAPAAKRKTPTKGAVDRNNPLLRN